MKKLACLSVLLLALGLASMAMAEEVKKYPNAPIEARVVPSAATQVAEDQAKEAKEEPEEEGLSGSLSIKAGGFINSSGQKDSKFGLESCLNFSYQDYELELWGRQGGNRSFNEVDVKVIRGFNFGHDITLKVSVAHFNIHPYSESDSDYLDFGVKLEKIFKFQGEVEVALFANLQYATALGEDGRGGLHGDVGAVGSFKASLIPGDPQMFLGVKLIPRVGRTFDIEDGLLGGAFIQPVWDLPIKGLKVGPKFEVVAPFTSFSEDDEDNRFKDLMTLELIYEF